MGVPEMGRILQLTVILLHQKYLFQLRIYVCDWIEGNRSKSHIGSYHIIYLKGF